MILYFLIAFFKVFQNQNDIPITQGQTTGNQQIEITQNPETVKKEFPYNISLQNTEGDVINTSKLFKKNRKATVLLFWMTTCGPCRSELTAISGKFNTWKKSTDFDFYAISMDFPNRFEQFKTRVKESQWPFPAYFDFNREFCTVMPGELNGLPQLFVFDKEGKIIYTTRRYQAGDEDKLFEVLKKV
ncbi:MAG: TlpA family protein disulfide reductase [Saprospiraceae bacterium]|nr:TlpA family protein disulfide reductase [Saprospiraceae bacterium]